MSSETRLPVVVIDQADEMGEFAMQMGLGSLIVEAAVHEGLGVVPTRGELCDCGHPGRQRQST